MINGISNNNNRPAFTGMSIRSIQNFIPDISSELAEKVSVRLNKEMPKDHLSMMMKGGKTLTHLVEIEGGQKIPIGEVTYKGSSDSAEKIEFLYDIAELIKKGILYV